MNKIRQKIGGKEANIVRKIESTPLDWRIKRMFRRKERVVCNKGCLGRAKVKIQRSWETLSLGANWDISWKKPVQRSTLSCTSDFGAFITVLSSQPPSLLEISHFIPCQYDIYRINRSTNKSISLDISRRWPVPTSLTRWRLCRLGRDGLSFREDLLHG